MNRPCTHRRLRGSRIALAAAAAAAVALAPSAASAAPSCTFLVASDLAFGSYDPLAAVPLDSTATIEFRCPQGQIAGVTVDSGSSGSFTWRELRQGSEVLRYNLYLDAARTIVWGDGTGGSSLGPGLTTRDGRRTIASVFARVPAGQDVSAGSYVDVIRVTIEL